MQRITRRLSPGSRGDSDHDSFQPLITVEFRKDVKQELLDWLVLRIRAAKSVGGAELLVRTDVDKKEVERFFYVSATCDRLLETAEVMGLRKRHKDGYVRDFTCQDMLSFTDDGSDIDNILSMAEKQRIVLHELENMRALECDTHLPGYEKLTLYVGKSLLRKCLNNDVVLQTYPLHEKEQLKKLGHEWYQTFFSPQPYDDIRHYFGEKLAIYFSFLGFYTKALLPPAFIGLVYFFTAWDNLNKHTFFAIFNMVWVTVFLESWKRNCSELAYKWGTIRLVQIEEPRAAFKGEMGKNPITGKTEPVYPAWKTHLKVYGGSFPFVLFCLFVASYVMVIYFRLEFWAQGRYKLNPSVVNFLLCFFPTSIYAVVIAAMNAGYRILATKLTNWENHRLQSTYENYLIVKLVLFNFTNCFLCLFYIAFVIQDLQLLRRSLATLLITMQIVQQCQETLLPYMFKKYTKYQIEKGKTEGEDGKETKVDHLELERKMLAYPGTFDDYLELFLQFGYAFLFSSVYPLAAFWALLNNVLEIRTDAFKLCRVFQRPYSQPAGGIGAWQVAFELMGIVAVMTNCALIALSPGTVQFFPDMGTVHIILLFVAIEHLVLGVKVLLSYVIPDTPEWVESALARIDFESRQALKKEKSSQARKALEKRSSHLCFSQSANETSL